MRDVKYFTSLASSLYQNSCFANFPPKTWRCSIKCNVLSQKLKSKNLPPIWYVFFIYLHCEIYHKSPYNLRFGPGKVLEKSLVLIHQNLWEPCFNQNLNSMKISFCSHSNSNKAVRGILQLTLLMLETEYSGFGGQYHACRCPGSWSCQSISRHVIDCVK